MINKFKINYIFNIIAFLIPISIFGMFILFQQTKKDIENINLQGQIEYITNITNNISDTIKKSTNNKRIFNALVNNENLRETLEDNLELFITPRYRYIYVVDKESKDSNEFRFLLDGAKKYDDKSEFLELYLPLNMKKWNNVYKTKKAIYFKNTDTKNVWMTYLKPIIVNNKVEAIIAIDFSLKENNLIEVSLNEFENIFKIMIISSIIIFITIILFSYIDKKREKTKEILYNKLQKESNKVKELNKSLASKIKDAIKETKQKEKLLQEQSRLAQMGEMISMIAHQWRQPLGAISSSVMGIQSKLSIGKFDLEQKEDRDKFLKFIDKKHKNIGEYVKTLSETIDDFRNFFKPDKEKEKVNFNEPIKRALKIVETSMSSKGIDIRCDFKTTIEMNMYQNELMQVVLNILKNAEDNFMEKKIENPKIEIITSEISNGCKIEIFDNGGGIPEDILPNIFDPYFSTKSERNGTGIGLYMSKIIIEEHHGGLLSVNNINQGACFEIKLNNEKVNK